MGEALVISTYVDEAGQHRWRLTDPTNGEIVGASTEGFVDERDLERNIDLHFGADRPRVRKA